MFTLLVFIPHAMGSHYVKSMQNTPSRLPALISKSELRRAIGCTSRKQWQSKIVTDNLLSMLNMDREQFNRLRLFDADRSRLLIQYFNLTPNDFIL